MSPVKTKAKSKRATQPKRDSPTKPVAPAKQFSPEVVLSEPTKFTGPFSVERAEMLRQLGSLELPETDGVPLESLWHRSCINLLVESIQHQFHDRADYSVGGNMCFYYDVNQAKNKNFLGPDFYFVNGLAIGNVKVWATWEHGGRFPDVVMELLSPSTKDRDRNEKKEIYRATFRTPEYFLYDPETTQLEGFRLDRHLNYRLIQPDAQGMLWSEQLQLFVGTWYGEFQTLLDTWPRFFDSEHQRVLNPAEAERDRANEEADRANEAERKLSEASAELARLKSQLANNPA